MPQSQSTPHPNQPSASNEVDNNSQGVSRLVFVRGIGLAVGTLAAVPAATWNAVSALAASAPRGKGVFLGSVRTLRRNKALTYTDPASGDPAILIRLNDGKLVSYDAVCTHAGCTVGYDPTKRMLVCPCHSSVFDPTRAAAVVRGPAPSPLPTLNIRVDANGNAYALDGKATSGAKRNKLQPSKPPVVGSGDDGGGQTKHGTRSRRGKGGDDGGGGGDD